MPVKTYDTRAQEADLYHRGHSAYDQGSGFSDLSGRPERVISVSLPRGLIATQGMLVRSPRVQARASVPQRM